MTNRLQVPEIAKMLLTFRDRVIRFNQFTKFREVIPKIRKGGFQMYPNIKAELARKDMTMVDLSNATGIRYQTLVSKLKGNYQVTIPEAISIKQALRVDMPLEVLFEKKETV